jgi:hypothetical protein
MCYNIDILHINIMIHLDPILNLWQFYLPHHNVNKARTPYKFSQLFIDDLLYLLNTKSGKIYTNTIDLDKVVLLKLYNWCHDNDGSSYYTQINMPRVNERIIFGSIDINYLQKLTLSVCY